jgi:serine/threonine-protein kinase
MGVVELAFRRERTFRRTLAVKRLQEQLAADPAARAQFEREARFSTLIRHPNVVEVIDVGSDEDGGYLVMDYVSGVSLRELMETIGAGLPVQHALQVAVAVARGLDAVHTLRDDEGRLLKLVHRDVTPSNVLIDFHGVPRLSDFGIARMERDQRTQEIIRGTSGYISPEQFRFEPVDARADLFSLGVVLFEMLSGTRLYGDEDTNAAAARTLREAPPDLRHQRTDLSESLGALVSALLHKDPAQRPQSARAVARALEAERRALVRSSGTEDFQAFLEFHLATQFEAQRAWLQERWESVGREDGASVPSPRPAPIAAGAVSGPQRSKRWRIALVAAVALGVFGWLGWTWVDSATSTESADVSSEPSVGTAVDLEPLTPTPNPVPVPIATPEPDDPETEAAETEAANTETPEMHHTPATMRSMRGTMRRTGSMNREGGRRELWMW